MEKELLPVDREKIPQVWPHLVGLLDPYIEKTAGRVTNENVFQQLLHGDWRLWVIWDQKVEMAVAFLAVSFREELSGDRTARIEFMVGENRKAWLPYITLIETWARDNGYKHIEMLVPKAFARDLPEYHMTQVFLERAL